jgi:large subunit ribosomal protein L30
LDVAIILIQDKDFERLAGENWRVLNESSIARFDPRNSRYIVAGFSRETLARRQLNWRESFTQIYTSPYAGGAADADHSVLRLAYARAAPSSLGETANTPHLGGLSGSSVWNIISETDGPWAPEKILKVVALQVSFVHGKYITAEWWTLVMEVFHQWAMSNARGTHLETFKIIQTGSPIRRHRNQRQTLIGLKLNRIGRMAEVPNTRATWGMIAKVRHLIRIVDEELFQEHRFSDPNEINEDADKRLIRNLIFEPRRIRAEDIPEDVGKTPDFKLFKNDVLSGFCEMKSPTDGDLFDVPDDLEPGELRVEVGKDPAIFNLARHIAKAAKQFKAVNSEHLHPNILVFANHARRKGPADLRMALEGIRAPDGRRFFPLVNDKDGWEVQKDVWEAARSIDLYVWLDPRKRAWQAFKPAGARRLKEACELVGVPLV